MEDGLVRFTKNNKNTNKTVLILVVMEDSLVHYTNKHKRIMVKGLNPCCNGRWSSTMATLTVNGGGDVLILVVMEDGLVLANYTHPQYELKGS